MNQSRAIHYILTLMLMAIGIMDAAGAGQRTEIVGLVRDSVTHEPVAYAAIFLKGSDRGSLTDENGRFEIVTTAIFTSLEVSTIGYNDKTVFVKKGQKNDIIIDLVPTGLALKEVVVKPKKEKYSKKNNPAVAFVEKLMKRKHMYDPRNNDYFSYDKYEKISLALNDFKKEEKTGWIYKKFNFLFDFVDTSEVSGKPILNVSVKEKASEVIYRKSPRSEKEIVKGQHRSGIDEIFDEESMQVFAEDVLREIDIFGNDVAIMQNRFVSPLSNIGTNFYKYYLTDTIDVEGERCIELSFVPHTPETFGFLGRIYVPLNDTTLFIKRVKLDVPKSINLNYVQNMYIQQDYVKAPDGSRLKMSDDMIVELQIVPGAQGLYTRRFTAYSNHSFAEPENQEYFQKAGTQIVLDDAQLQPEEFWKDNRKSAIGQGEGQTHRLLAKLREVPVFYWSEKVLSALITGYVPTREKNSKFDIGPMNTMFSGNSLEGFRLRTGGITTANLSKHLFARGYVAYGFKDKELKYNAELEYSFNKKKYHSLEFPVHSIKASYKYDVDQLGQQYLFTNMDNVFLALKRKKDDKMTYKRLARLEYKYEHRGGFSLTAGFGYEKQIATQYMPFEDGFGNLYRDYSEASFDLTLRYAPGEKFYQSKTQRYPINFDAPIFTVKQTIAPKGFLGSKFCINRTEVSVQKRFWFSAFGYADVLVKGGKIWSEVPYINLLLPNANLSYTIQPESFALMNAMEFANDQYVSWDLTYWANGALFNRIPLIKYLKLREVVSFRGIYGSLSDKNNPATNNDLFRFPYEAHCKPMDKKPYMEIGVGIDNILTFLRLDYVWRLSYRDTPGVDLSGLRVQLHFTF